MHIKNSEIESVRAFIQDGDLHAAVERFITLTRGTSAADEAIAISGALRTVERDLQKRLTTMEMAAIEKAFVRERLLTSLRDFEQQECIRTRELPKFTGTLAPFEQLEKQMGPESHLRNVGWLRLGLELGRAVCRIRVGNAMGSGFLFNGWLFTNQHVIASAADAASASCDFGFDHDGSLGAQEIRRVSLDSTTFKEAPAELDCIAVRLAKDHGLANLGHITLAQRRPALLDAVSVIQHPHGRPKEVAVTNNRIVNLFDHRIHYSTDTLPGSSGSPVFDQDWKLIAIHHAGGDMVKNSAGERIFANEGIKITSILSALRIDSEV